MSKFPRRPFRLQVLDSPEPPPSARLQGRRRQAVGVLDVEGEGVSDEGYRRDTGYRKPRSYG